MRYEHSKSWHPSDLLPVYFRFRLRVHVLDNIECTLEQRLDACLLLAYVCLKQALPTRMTMIWRFTSLSTLSRKVISRRRNGDNEMLCAMKRRTIMSLIPLQRDSNSGLSWSELGSVNHSTTRTFHTRLMRSCYIYHKPRIKVDVAPFYHKGDNFLEIRFAFMCRLLSALHQKSRDNVGLKILK